MIVDRLPSEDISSFTICLEGLSTFNNKVLYADVPPSADRDILYRVAGEYTVG